MSTSVRKTDEAKIKDYKDDIDTLLVLVSSVLKLQSRRKVTSTRPVCYLRLQLHS